MTFVHVQTSDSIASSSAPEPRAGEWHALQRRHDLMIELYRVQQACDRGREKLEAAELQRLVQYRQRIEQALEAA